MQVEELLGNESLKVSMQMEKIIENYDARKAAMRSVNKRRWEVYYNLKHIIGETGDKMDVWREKEIIRMKEKKALAAARKYGNDFMWLTVSPDWKSDYFKKLEGEIPLLHFLRAIDKFCARKMNHGAMYVIEQRGKVLSKMGKGGHAHILCRRVLSYKPSEYAKNARNTFKRFCDCKQKKYFDCSPAYVPEDKIMYMLGQKDGKVRKAGLKADSVRLDRKWRTKCDFRPFYLVGSLGEKPSSGFPEFQRPWLTQNYLTQLYNGEISSTQKKAFEKTIDSEDCQVIAP